MSENPYEAPQTTRFRGRREGTMLQARFRIDSKLLYRAYSFYAWQTALMCYFVFPVTSLALLALLAMLLLDAPRSYLIICAVVFCVVHVVQMAIPHVQVRWLMRQARKHADLPLTGLLEIRVNGILAIRQSDRWVSLPLDELLDVQFVGDMLLVTIRPGLVLPIPEQGDFGEDTFMSFCEAFAKRVHETRSE